MSQDEVSDAMLPEEPQEATAPKLTTVDEIVAALAEPTGRYPREAVDAAIAHRAEIVPRLIAILEEAIADPEDVIDRDDDFGLDFALMLLGHFREPTAHPAILRLCALRKDLADGLMGDMITEDLPVILLRTAGGTFAGVKGIAANEDIDEFVRGAAIRAIAFGVAENAISREEALAFLVGFLADDVNPGENYGIHFSLCECLMQLHPEEHMDAIRQAHDHGIIDPDEYPIGDFEQAVANGRDACLHKLKDELARYTLDDLHDCMSH